MEKKLEIEDSAKKNLEPVQPKVAEKSPIKEVDEKTRLKKERVAQCMKLADEAFFAKNYIEAREHLLKAETIDSTVNIKDQLQDVEAILTFKSTEAYKVARESLSRGDFYDAERHIKEAFRLNPTKEVKDFLDKTTAELFNRKKAALLLVEKAEEAKKYENYYDAEKYLKDAKQQDPGIDVTDELIEIQQHITFRQSQASSCIMAADDALKNKDYYKAEKFLIQAQQHDPKCNVQAKMSHVNKEIEALIKEASSCVAAADIAINDKDFSSAEKWLIQAQENNPKIDVEAKLSLVKSQSIDKNAALKRKAERHLQEAEKALLNNEQVLAEELVQKANSLVFLDKSKELTSKIIASRASLKYNSTLETNNESPLGNERAMIDNCISKAKEAYEKGNLDSAIRFYEKAFRMEPSCTVADELQRIKAEIEQAGSSNKPNIPAATELHQRALRYYELAEEAAKLKEYDLVIEYLNESIQLFQTEEAKNFLKAVQEAKFIDEIAQENNPKIDVEAKLSLIKSQLASALKRKAERHLQEAQKALLNNELDLAEELVKQANSLVFLDKSKELTSKIIASRALLKYNFTLETNNKLPLGNEQVMIDNCVSKAKEAYEKGNLDAAIRFYEKAFRMEPSIIVADELQRIKAEKEQAGSSNKPNIPAATTEHISELHQRAHRYYKLAVDAAKLKKYDVAIGHLNESITLHRTLEAKKLLKEVQKAKSIDEKRVEISYDDESSSEPDNFKDPDESPHFNAVEKYVGYALDDMRQGLHYAAESWLKLANGIHETETVSYLLKTVNLTLKHDNVKSSKNANLRYQSRQYLEKAYARFLKESFDEASLFVIISENVYTIDGRAGDLMESIFKNQYLKKYNCLANKVIGRKKNKFKNMIETKRYDEFMSDCYHRAACIALKMDNSTLAIQYLEKSLTYNRTVERTKALTELRANKHGDPGIFRYSLNFFKGYLFPK